MGRILIVDDDESIRDALGEVLAMHGYLVDVAENGARALEKMRGPQRPDLVLLDLMMPVLSGWEVLEIAMSDDELRTIPIVVVSAMPAPLAPREDVGGVKRCMQKPIALDVLLEVVDVYSRGDREAVV